jgi:hypothetical protein
MNYDPMKRISENTAALTSAPVLVGSGLALSLALSISPVGLDQFFVSHTASRYTGLIKLAVDEPLIRSQWNDAIRRAEFDDVERELAPFVAPIRTRPVTLHIVHGGRGLPIV